MQNPEQLSKVSPEPQNPVILELHQPITEYTSKNFTRFSTLIKSPFFNRIVVITQPLKTMFLDQFRDLKEKVCVLPDGADEIDEATKPILFQNSQNRFQVGYVGHLYDGRGIDLILNIAKKCPWADFNIVGGTVADINRWKLEAKDLENVVFHGFVAPSQATKMALGCDVLLAPYQEKVCVAGNVRDTSRWMSPLKIFEYMATGRAIIASDLPVLKEILVNEQNSILCPPSSLKIWTEALFNLYRSCDFRSKIAQNAKMDFSQKYTWNIRAQRALSNVNF